MYNQKLKKSIHSITRSPGSFSSRQNESFQEQTLEREMQEHN